MVLSCRHNLIIKALHKIIIDTIVGISRDSTLFLGGGETTLKELSKTPEKKLLTYITHQKRSNQKSFGLNYQKTGKEL